DFAAAAPAAPAPATPGPASPAPAAGPAPPAPAPAAGPGLAEYKGEADQLDERTGLSALELDAYREVALVAAPGITDKTICDAILTHCENSKFRFAVLDS